MTDHRPHATHLAADLVADEQHADDDDDHLDEIGDRHRPHAAEERIDEDGAGAYPHPHDLADLAARHHVEHQAERGDLRPHPAEVGDHDGDGGQHLDAAAELLFVEIAYGQQVHAVQRRGEKQPDQDQAHGGAEGIGDDAVQSFLQESRGDAEHRFGPEPRGEHRGGDHIKRQVAPGDGEIAGVMHTRGRIQADADRNDPIGDDEPQQHVSFLRLTMALILSAFPKRSRLQTDGPGSSRQAICSACDAQSNTIA